MLNDNDKKWRHEFPNTACFHEICADEPSKEVDKFDIRPLSTEKFIVEQQNKQTALTVANNLVQNNCHGLHRISRDLHS